MIGASAETEAVILNPLRASALIDQAAIEAARNYQKAHGGRLSDALLRLNLVKEADFLRVFAELYATRFVKSDKLRVAKVDAELLEKVGVRLAERLHICPIRLDSARSELHVVAAIPLAASIESELRKHFGVKSISLYVASAAAVQGLIRRWFYREDDAFEAVTMNGAGPHESSRTQEMQGLEESTQTPEDRSAKTVMVSLSEVAESTTVATLRKENARYRIAQEFHRRVSQERSTSATIESILEVIFDLLPAEGAAIVLTNGEVTTRARKGLQDKTVDVPQTVIDQTLISPAGVLVNNALIDQRFDRSQSVMIRGVQSVMAVPLRARNRTLGVLYVDSISQSAAFSDDDLPLLDSIGSQAAILLDNAELIARVQQEVENRANLSRFLSPAAVEEVLSGRMALKLEGQSSEVTVLFADIRGFTTMSEKMKPEEVVQILNRYFEECVDAVEQHHGTVDKFIGDCVMALWGAPTARPDDAKNAMMAALQMVQRTQRILINGQPLEMGIGVHTGLAVVGGVGSKKRLDYTAIGTTVNLAARLCGIARTAEVLVTQDTINKVGPSVIAEANEPVILKGLEAPITPYTLKGFGAPQAAPIRLYNVATQPMGQAVGAHQGPRPQAQLEVRATEPALPKRR